MPAPEPPDARPEGRRISSGALVIKPFAALPGPAQELVQYGTVSSQPFTVPEPNLAETDRRLVILYRELHIVEHTISLLQAHRLTLVTPPTDPQATT
jgi:hypothetical protein